MTNSKKQAKPIMLNMSICDLVLRDQKTNNVSLINLFNQMGMLMTTKWLLLGKIETTTAYQMILTFLTKSWPLTLTLTPSTYSFNR